MNYKSASKEPVTYTARATFTISDKKEEVAWNDFSSLDLGISERKAIKYNLDKVVEYTRSRKVIQRALFRKVTINGTENYIANHMIDIYKFHDKWVEAGEDMGDFYYSHDTIPKFNRNENKALKNLYFKVVGSGVSEPLVTVGYDENSTVIRISGKTVNEALTISLVKEIYFSLADYYVEVETKRQQEVFKLIYASTDTVRINLIKAQRRLLAYLDRNQGLALRQYDAKKLVLQQEVDMWVANLAESFKSLQATKAALANTIPFVHPIDLPVIPLRPSIVSRGQAVIMGIIVGGILGAIGVVAKKILWQIMGWEKKKEEKAKTTEQAQQTT